MGTTFAIYLYLNYFQQVSPTEINVLFFKGDLAKMAAS